MTSADCFVPDPTFIEYDEEGDWYPVAEVLDTVEHWPAFGERVYRWLAEQATPRQLEWAQWYLDRGVTGEPWSPGVSAL